MDQSSESLRILKNRYGAGLATITDLLRAEDAERQSQTNTGTLSTAMPWPMPNCFTREGL